MPSSDIFKFSVTLNGGARLAIGLIIVIDRLLASSRTVSGSIELEEDGMYPIKIEYMHSTDEALIDLKWSTPTIHEQTVPASALVYSRPCWQRTIHSLKPFSG